MRNERRLVREYMRPQPRRESRERGVQRTDGTTARNRTGRHALAGEVQGTGYSAFWSGTFWRRKTVGNSPLCINCHH
ncbi:unnamed protein product [Sphagnum tenellum]